MLGALIGLFGGGQKSVRLNTTNIISGTTGPGTASSEYVSVIQTGLVSPITYNWTRVSGSTNIYVNVASSPTVQFYGYVNGAQITGVWKCTVTDSAGFSQDTENLNITFEDYRV